MYAKIMEEGDSMFCFGIYEAHGEIFARGSVSRTDVERSIKNTGGEQLFIVEGANLTIAREKAVRQAKKCNIQKVVGLE